jgi:hypothetical protein
MWRVASSVALIALLVFFHQLSIAGQNAHTKKESEICYGLLARRHNKSRASINLCYCRSERRAAPCFDSARKVGVR